MFHPSLLSRQIESNHLGDHCVDGKEENNIACADIKTKQKESQHFWSKTFALPLELNYYQVTLY